MPRNKIPDAVAQRRREELETLIERHHLHYGDHIPQHQIEHFMRHGTFGPGRAAEIVEKKKDR